MAEAIAALAFAGNILQFLEAGGKFSKKAYAIATAGSHNIDDIRELRHITEYLQPILKQLTRENHQNNPDAITGSQARLIALSKECSEVVKELLQTLDDAGVTDSGRRTDAVIAAFKLTWRQSEIQKLDNQIGKLRQQLAVDLLISIRENSCKALEQQEAILEHLRRDSKENTDAAQTKTNQGRNSALATDTMGTATLEYLNSRTDSDSMKSEVQGVGMAIEHILLHERDYRDYSSVYGQNYPKIEMDPMKRGDMKSKIISSLRYQEMDNRESNIAKAHKKTLWWLFKDNSPDRKDTRFRQWLESSERLYWITGKAGSGKSTLMKYISKLDGTSEGGLKCNHYLEKWAGNKDDLVVASFYFWASGTSMEASQQGLFQSLVFQLLSKRPELIPRAAPRIWEACCLFGWQPSAYVKEDLYLMLYNAVKVLVEEDNAKVCLFIDGLDELDGDPHELISTCQALLQLRNVKMCVSSRPWIVFQDAFGQAPSLMLQDFTYPDIKSFVVSKFGENEGFRRLQLRESAYADKLLDDITGKASGVFLWVKLVVKSLLAGLNHDDRVSDLERRLNLLPPDLERLYDAIIKDLDPFYLQHASQYFMLLQASEVPPEALLFSLADEEDPTFALTLRRRPLTEESRTIRIDTLRRRLNSRCKGLLELGAQDRVQYLHRSVKDYIDSDEVKRWIQGTAGVDFDCHLRICAANLAMLKTQSTDSPPPQESPYTYAEQCLKAAAKVKHNTSLMIQMLDCLDENVRPEPYSNHFREPFREAIGTSRRWPNYYQRPSFISVAVHFGVVDYVRARVEAGCFVDCDVDRFDPIKHLRFRQLIKNIKLPGIHTKGNIEGGSSRRGKRPLLLDANFCDPPSLSMFRCLLECGADPNFVFDSDGRTPWTETICIMLVSFKYTQKACFWEQWAPILELFLEHGASQDQKLCGFVCKIFPLHLKYLDAGRLGIVLDCVANGQKELGLRYLNGEIDTSVFHVSKKQSRRQHPKFNNGSSFFSL
ncbi:hypothetical protein GQX73_g3154 [Xylaria multiplex]|uniref:Uncharacterized protein n=1 Tax=Xylaria multiplex TaxID=323545 RepID=A0A7C8MXB1_9PEZI|nr:hypothetical protein GQX73_g3154 [Xylaria multiplex]